MRNIIVNHHTFWEEAKKDFKYDSYVGKILNYIENNEEPVHIILEKKKNAQFVWDLLFRITQKFMVCHPKLYSKYFGWDSYYKINIKKEDYIDLLKSKNTKDLLKFLYTKI